MSALDSITVNVETETGNVVPLLHEIRHALGRLADQQEGTIIDLRSLPLAPGEEKRIEKILGQGEIRVEVDLLGPSLIEETSYPGVWLVTHRNAENEIVARFIEVTRIPELLKSQPDDIRDAIGRLEEDLTVTSV